MVRHNEKTPVELGIWNKNRVVPPLRLWIVRLVVYGFAISVFLSTPYYTWAGFVGGLIGTLIVAVLIVTLITRVLSIEVENCVNCGHRHYIEDNFCEMCGTELKMELNNCANCGHRCYTEDNFCEMCGTELIA